MRRLLNPLRSSRYLAGLFAGLGLALSAWAVDPATTPVQSAGPVTFVLTSDLHYGLTRSYFRGAANVEARLVDAALARKLNRLPEALLPEDGGLRAGKPVGPVAFVAITGDLTNRQELYPLHIQTAAVSWRQFEEGFLGSLTLHDEAGQPTPVLLMPGNHDVSNAIGAPSPLLPATDATSMAGIYNRMMRPVTPRTAATYDFATDKINYSRDLGGVHLVFLTIWPDSVERAWLEHDLQAVPASTPVFIFCHDQPDIDARHLKNPNGRHDINAQDRFENIVSDTYADGPMGDAGTAVEQRALVAFLKAHRNIVGYFHGHSNYNEFYTWEGPDHDVALNVFRVDSPIKGKQSGKNEALLSFQVATYDAAAQSLTVRECRWNAMGPADSDTTPVAWGASRTVSLAPRAQ